MFDLARICSFWLAKGAVSGLDARMTQNFRHPEILELARKEGKVTVEGLAAHFGVTLQTIRRDLTDLAEAGALARVHGGAVLPSGTTNIGYDDRRVLNEAAKRAMAEVCAGLIPDRASLFLNIGTTTEAVARALGQHRDLLVVTNNMNVAAILTPHPSCELILAGGHLRRSDGGLTGSLTVQTIRAFKFDVAVIGCSALDVDGDLLDFDISEVAVSQTIIAQARRTILVADHSKFQRSAPARIASLEAVDVMVTDRPLPPPLQARCDSWDTRVLVAPPQD
jgi:DeoR family transcriptional regulator, glycerol-3-phosphate regulon repressor